MCVCFFVNFSWIYVVDTTICMSICWQKIHGFALRSCSADFGAKKREKKDGCLALEGQHRCFIDITCYYAGKNICKWFLYTNPEVHEVPMWKSYLCYMSVVSIPKGQRRFSGKPPRLPRWIPNMIR